MNIQQLLTVISKCCIYYYKRYNYIFYDKNIIIPNHIESIMAKHIYEYYVSNTNTEYVYDMFLMTEPFDKLFILDRDTISLGDMLDVIDEYIDKTNASIILTSDINIISLSKHPIENYVTIDFNWIKQILNLYLY